MRTRLLGFTAALVLAAFGAAVPVAQAAVPVVTGPDCVADGGKVEYDATVGLYRCVGATEYDNELITKS
ncbi:hypothetical protein ACIPUC_25500 [Streptomyces sp. LARHCF249]